MCGKLFRWVCHAAGSRLPASEVNILAASIAAQIDPRRGSALCPACTRIYPLQNKNTRSCCILLYCMYTRITKREKSHQTKSKAHSHLRHLHVPPTSTRDIDNVCCWVPCCVLCIVCCVFCFLYLYYNHNNVFNDQNK
jgi:hypothetical protein